MSDTARHAETAPNHHQVRFLRVLNEAAGPLTAKDLGSLIHGDAFDARTRSASAAQNAWELIRHGWAERTLKRRELYVYNITEAGRAALAKATSS